MVPQAAASQPKAFKEDGGSSIVNSKMLGRASFPMENEVFISKYAANLTEYE